MMALQSAEAAGLERRSQAETPDDRRGFYVEVDSFPGIGLALAGLDPQRGRLHPELRGVRTDTVEGAAVERAVVWVPFEKAAYFIRRVEQYLETNERPTPANADLIERIERISLATLEAFWTDRVASFPAGTEPVWWEIWLRRSDGRELIRLREWAVTAGAHVGARSLALGDRVIALVEASPPVLASAVDLLDDIAELRRPGVGAEMLAEEGAAEQMPWIEDLAARTVTARPDSPAVCVLDTGVQRVHPLLEASLAAGDCHACDPTWGTDDHKGHGTAMAGLALYGRLDDPIAQTGPVRLGHRLESVKLLPRANDTPRGLWGAMTAVAASLVEAEAPGRHRVFSVAIAADTDAPLARGPLAGVGQPTGWSAAVDALAAGQQIATTDDGLVVLEEGGADATRLFIVAAGNVEEFDDDLGDDFLDRCDLSAIRDPGQAWNAITVGAMTDRDSINVADGTFVGWLPLAPHGELSPCSRTSVNHDRKWPVKPDVVLEGGNHAKSPDGRRYDTPPSLQLLTTARVSHGTRPLTVTGQTSAATAQAGHLAASIMTQYPRLWPETVRALIIHSAEWTPAMRAHLGTRPSRGLVDSLKRRYGMGVPDLTRATRSATDALTLVAEDVIHPFADGTMNEMMVHQLPWPETELASLGAAQVGLRVTLSYFIEPYAARRGWESRYGYQSHGLRFDLRRPTETDRQFRGRVNQLARGDGWDGRDTDTDASQWFFGPNSRTSGSVFSDIWEGSAIDLARRGSIAVYPVGGWWKERPRLDRSAAGARYALVVSIETPGQEVDIWTPVAIEAGVAVQIET